MPRISTKRCENWGTKCGPKNEGDGFALLDRVERGDKWRKARNKRKAGR